MRSAEELASARELIKARRELAARVADVRASIDQLVEEGAPVAIFSCELSHPRGKSAPKVAEAVRVGDEVLFVSLIAWRPGDQLRLTPWEREWRLGQSLDQVSLKHMLEDDLALDRMLDDLDRLEKGVEPTGPRWLKSTGPHEVATLIDPSDDPLIVAPWVRCPSHPAAAEILDRATLFDATR